MHKATRLKSNAAIYYLPDGYSTSGKNIMGIHAASEGFMSGFARHADIDMAYCAVDNDAGANAFHEVFARARRSLPVKAFPIGRPELLAEPGCLYLPGPGLSEFAWQRRQVNQRDYSLCGVTHTTASAVVMDAITDFAVAPIQPWDALICTSQSVRNMVETLLADHAAYLKDRLGASTFVFPQMPVIPLGIDSTGFVHDGSRRREWREKLGIAEEDIAVLFFGRLSFHGKAHPIPMYQALAKAAGRVNRRFHLIHAGWFPTDSQEALYRNNAAETCPTVNLIFVNGLDADVRRTIWSAADIFTSLTDNIQETFGLTPIEAMAAGLPVVVSDWDGYRDTVRDGVDGFRIPTLMSPAPYGGDLAYQHGSGRISYDVYIGRTAQFVSVDIELCADAYARLADDADLRRQMGAEGSRRAESIYDWKVIIASYQELWGELALMRQSANESVAHKGASSARPTRPDPFHVFASYPSANLSPEDIISRTENGPEWLKVIRSSPLVSFAEEVLPTEAESLQILVILGVSTKRAADLVGGFPMERQALIFRGLVWMAKYRLIAVTRSGS